MCACRSAQRHGASDSSLATRTVEHAKALFGFLPRQITFDGGFASQNNLADIKALGVEDAALHERRGLEIDEMARSKRVCKRLRAFRAGIEGTISFLERSFGLERCTWRGFQPFSADVDASVLACNLLVAARHILAARAAA